MFRYIICFICILSIAELSADVPFTIHDVGSQIGASHLKAADMDDDGDRDIVVSSYNGHRIDWFEDFMPPTISVPQDLPKIQAAIDSAKDGDVVLVDEGTYYENINFKGKAITVASHYLIDGDMSHIESTIINGSRSSYPDSGSVAYFVSGEDTNSVLCGFTITGGKGTYVVSPNPEIGAYWSSGGILVWSSGAKIISNVIRNNVLNKANAWSGGVEISGESNDIVVFCDNIISQNVINSATTAGGGGIGIFTKGTVYLQNNTITKNRSTGNSSSWGGGVCIDGAYSAHGTIYLYNNRISHNEVYQPGSGVGWGGGIYMRNIYPILKNNVISHNTNDGYGGGLILHDGEAHPWPTGRELTLVNNTITQNSSLSGGGVSLSGNSSIANIENTIIWNNSAKYDPEFEEYNGSSATVTYSDIKMNSGVWPGFGNINADPLLIDTMLTSGNTLFSILSTGSPCIDAGNDKTIHNDLEDTHNTGFALWPARGSLRNDMGAYGGPNGGPRDSLTTSIEKLDQIITIPHNYTLQQNFPNPFNPKTTIEFSLRKTEFVSLRVYNILGQEVATLVSEKLSGKKYRYTWDASDFASGVYIYEFKAGKSIACKKMILLQ